MAEKHRIRTDRFAVTLLPEEREILSKNAEKFGLSKTEFIRRLILFGGITERPLLDKETGSKLIEELTRINESLQRASYETPAEQMDQHPEWQLVKETFIALLGLIGQLSYITAEEEAEWQQRVYTQLHKQ